MYIINAFLMLFKFKRFYIYSTVLKAVEYVIVLYFFLSSNVYQ